MLDTVMQGEHGFSRVESKAEGSDGLIARTVRKQIPGVVDSVFVKSDVDFYGDKIYRIFVAINDMDPATYGREIVPLIASLREHLQETGDSGFPVVSLISRDGISKLKLEAA